MIDEQLASIGPSEHTEWRIFGPPGCGKTTHTSRQVRRAVEKYGPDRVLITSFSRAAAAELAGRDLPVDRKAIGTLHAHCYRALGHPTLAETKVKDWNEAYPQFRMAGASESDVDDPNDLGDGSGDGDELLAAVNRHRNLLHQPLGEWLHPREHSFWKTWTDWKASNGFLDFTDLLETSLRDIRVAPGGPDVIFADEAQDFTALQLALIRQWGKHTEYFLTVGDDDQTIYSFTGATPDAFLKPAVPDSQKIVLSQSYRVPAAVHAKALPWIEQCLEREPKEYRPTSHPGTVAGIDNGSWRAPGPLLDKAEFYIAQGKTVLVLTSCGYMLDPLLAEARQRGLPFHNPYRRRDGRWNPLHSSRGTTAADRVRAFLRPNDCYGEQSRLWTVGEFRAWADWVKADGTPENEIKVFTRGTKTELKERNPDDPVTAGDMARWLTPAAREQLGGTLGAPIEAALEWWVRLILPAHRKTAAYPCNIATRRGLESLEKTPQLMVGTIHSVKGGEADVVILCPDLSQAGDGQWRYAGPAGRDTIRRQFYVGMTRARETLLVANPAGSWMVEI